MFDWYEALLNLNNYSLCMGVLSIFHYCNPLLYDSPYILLQKLHKYSTVVNHSVNPRPQNTPLLHSLCGCLFTAESRAHAAVFQWRTTTSICFNSSSTSIFFWHLSLYCTQNVVNILSQQQILSSAFRIWIQVTP